MCKIHESNDLLDNVNKIMALTDHLACIEKPIRNINNIMTLLKSLAGFIQVFDRHFGDNVDNRAYDGLRGAAFDGQDVKRQRQRA